MKPEQRTDSRPAPWEPIPEFSPPDPQIEARLRELWRTIDRRLERFCSTCRACGQCCDFPRRHHVLFATKGEMDVCLSWAMKNLSLTQADLRRRLACGRCPFQQDRLCAVHPVRPLGCRYFFCIPEHRRRLDRVSGLAQRRIRQILKGANNLGWYGPALSYFTKSTHYFL